MKNFKDINADYQVTDYVRNISVKRILSENKKLGNKFVFIISDLNFTVFFNKKIAKLLEGCRYEINEISRERKDYGIMKTDSFGNVVESNTIIGSEIIGSGFTHVITNSNYRFEIIYLILKNIDIIEYYADIDRKKELADMTTVKVISG